MEIKLLITEANRSITQDKRNNFKMLLAVLLFCKSRAEAVRVQFGRLTCSAAVWRWLELGLFSAPLRRTEDALRGNLRRQTRRGRSSSSHTLSARSTSEGQTFLKRNGKGVMLVGGFTPLSVQLVCRRFCRFKIYFFCRF